MRLKSVVERALRSSPRLYAIASRAYHTANGSFRTLSPGAPPSISRGFELARAAALADGRDPNTEVGDYYEFGLFRGYTFLSAQRAADELGLTGTRFYGFDSFKGLPPVVGADRPEPGRTPLQTFDGHFFEGQYACSRRQVERSLSARGFDWSRAALIEGFYNESLTPELKERFPFRPAAVVLFDCDLYSSTRDAMAWMDDLLRPGSVLLFDDWFSYGDAPGRGQPRAFGEFLAARPDLRAEALWEFENNGKAFVLRAAKPHPRQASRATSRHAGARSQTREREDKPAPSTLDNPAPFR